MTTPTCIFLISIELLFFKLVRGTIKVKAREDEANAVMIFTNLQKRIGYI